MRRVASIVLLAGAVALPLPASAKLESYRFDTVHCQLQFYVWHLGFSKAEGEFHGLSGGFRFDPEDWSRASVDVTIAIDSLDMDDAGWEKKLKSDQYFDVERFPTARYVSSSVEKTGPEAGVIHGELTLHGVSRPLDLSFTLNRIGRHSYSLKYVAGFSAQATLQRSDFGIRHLLPAVGDAVELRLEIEGLRQRGGADKTDTP